MAANLVDLSGHARTSLPKGVFHEDLARPFAAQRFNPDETAGSLEIPADGYMPDETTRDCARRMHYALYRARRARTAAALEKWKSDFYRLRDAIVVGNRKLIYRAVRQKMHLAHRMDDMIGECSLVLIRAVAAYNPWLGIRFSTYAFTCLLRALSRLSQRYASDRLERCLPLDTLSQDHLPRDVPETKRGEALQRLDSFLAPGHPLLSAREKAVLTLRYGLIDESTRPTLETVGRELGISKERVRQVQASALGKLREALATAVAQRDPARSS